MAITVDVQPAYAQVNNGFVVTTASFTPTTGSLLVAIVACGNGNGTAGTGSSAITDTGTHSWSLLVRKAFAAGGFCEVWCADNSSTSSITVTATGQVQFQDDIAIQVISYLGCAASASQTGATNTANADTVSLTTTTNGSQVVGGFGYEISGLSLTANANTTIFGQTIGALGDTEATWKASSLTGTPGATTFGFTNTTAASMVIAGAEILPAATGSVDPGPDLFATVGYPPGLNFYIRPTPGPWLGSDPHAIPNLSIVATEATGTGVANDATVIVAPNASNAAGTDTASNATDAVAPNASNAAGTGTANSAVATVAPNASNAAGTGTANNATVAIAVNAENVTATGTAYDLTSNITEGYALPYILIAPGFGPFLIGQPQPWLGSDPQAAVAGSASPAEATGTGVANDATVIVAPNASNAAGTGTANSAVATVAPNAGNAAGTGTAYDATVIVAPNASNTAGTGTANDAVAAIGVNAGNAAGTGTANNATVTTGGGSSGLTLVAQTTFDHVAANNDTLTYTSAGSGSGSLMVVFASRSGGTATGAMTSVTDSASNTWTLATRGTVSGGTNTRIECWYTYNYSPVTSISLNSSSSQFYATSLTEWSGIDTSADPKDVSSPDNSGNATSTTQTTPAISTAAAHTLVLAAIHFGQTTGTFTAANASPTSGWTDLTNFDSTTVASGRAAYQEMFSTGSYDGSWTLGATKTAGTITVSFKVAATASGPPDATLTFIAPGLYQSPANQSPIPWQGTGSDLATPVSVNATEATGTGVAYDATVIVAPNASNATGTGTANSAVVAIAANAGNAAGTGTANGATATVTPNSGNGAANGTANNTTAAIAVNAENVTATGTAYDTTVTGPSLPSPDVSLIQYPPGLNQFGYPQSMQPWSGSGAGNLLVFPGDYGDCDYGSGNYDGIPSSVGTAYDATVVFGIDTIMGQPALATGSAFDARIPTVQFVKGNNASSASASTSLTVALASAPTAGNLLIFTMGGDKNTGALTLPGFNQVYTLNSASVSLYYFYKVSDGTETSITATWPNSSVSGNNAWYGEYKDDSISGGNWNIVAQASNITNEVTTNTWGTGTTGPASSNGLAIALATIDSSTSVTTRNAWGNGYTARFDTVGASGRGSPYVAELPITYNNTTSSTFNYTGTADQVSCAVAVWAKISEPHWDFTAPGLYQSPANQNPIPWAGSDAEVSASAVSVNAQTAQATGVANNVTTSGSSANAGSGAATGTANNATVIVKANTGVATITTSVSGTAHLDVTPNAALITGQAFNRAIFVNQDFTSIVKPITYSSVVKVITRTSVTRVDGT